MYKLCITDNPGIAAIIGKTIGAGRYSDGYYEGNGYLVTWAPGRLVELAEPEEYGYTPQKDIWRDKERALNELPILPGEFKTFVPNCNKKLFDIILELISREDVELVIDCGGMEPEKRYSQWLIRRQANCGKPVKRFCAAALTDGDIKKALASLRDIREYDKQVEAEFCRQKADWILSMSMSRCLSLKYGEHVAVDRAIPPTLYFVIKRYLDAQNYKPYEFYHVKANLDEDFSLYLKDFNLMDGTLITDVDSKRRLINKDIANLVAVNLTTIPNAVITHIETKRRAMDRPRLYDITELQRDANRIYGYAAADVLEAAFNLYERKLLSYPLTDSRFLPSSLKDDLLQRIIDIQEFKRYKDVAAELLSKKVGLNIDTKIIDDGKTADCHALIVTENIRGCDVTLLNEVEQNILHLVISRMVIAVSPKHVYDETAIEALCCDGRYVLTAKWTKTIQKGFMYFIDMLLGADAGTGIPQDTAVEEQVFPEIEIVKGQTLHISYATTITEYAAAPKLHTEATLLTAMDNAGAAIENGIILKGKGVGAPESRAGIIKRLFDMGYVVNKSEKGFNYIEPTRRGVNYIKILPEELYTPKVTADFEAQISAVADGTITSEQFMSDFIIFLNRNIEKANTANSESIKPINGEGIGICPFCKLGEIFVTTGKSEKSNKDIDIYFCSQKCGFSLSADSDGFFNNTGRTLLKKQVRRLINKGSIIATTRYDGKEEKFELLKNEHGKAYIRLQTKTRA